MRTFKQFLSEDDLKTKAKEWLQLYVSEINVHNYLNYLEEDGLHLNYGAHFSPVGGGSGATGTFHAPPFNITADSVVFNGLDLSSTNLDWLLSCRSIKIELSSKTGHLDNLGAFFESIQSGRYEQFEYRGPLPLGKSIPHVFETIPSCSFTFTGTTGMPTLRVAGNHSMGDVRSVKSADNQLPATHESFSDLFELQNILTDLGYELLL